MPEQTKGKECPKCGGDGLQYTKGTIEQTGITRVNCQLCEGTGRIYTVSDLRALEEKTILRNWISVKFENVQSDLNKNFDNIRMSAEHTEYLNKNYEVRKKELPPPPNTGS